jgi:hypothetical protein
MEKSNVRRDLHVHHFLTIRIHVSLLRPVCQRLVHIQVSGSASTKLAVFLYSEGRGGGGVLLFICHNIAPRNQRMDMIVAIQSETYARMLNEIFCFDIRRMRTHTHADDSKYKTACLHLHKMHVGTRRTLGAIALGESPTRRLETNAFSHLPFIISSKTRKWNLLFS